MVSGVVADSFLGLVNGPGGGAAALGGGGLRVGLAGDVIVFGDCALVAEGEVPKRSGFSGLTIFIGFVGFGGLGGEGGAAFEVLPLYAGETSSSSDSRAFSVLDMCFLPSAAAGEAAAFAAKEASRASSSFGACDTLLPPRRIAFVRVFARSREAARIVSIVEL